MKPQKQTISFYTLGCRLNQSETSVLKQLFSAAPDFSVLKDGEPAHICVINTCTVTEKGDRDARKIINKILRANPDTRFALIGCQAQTQKEDLKNLPNVAWVIGTKEKMRLLDIFRERSQSSVPRILTPPLKSSDFTLPVSTLAHDKTRANLKIQDGCDCFCSYCEIPYARGGPRSRIFQNIIEEASALVKLGHKEIVLTGINLGRYHFQEHGIVDVIDALEQISGLTRIRISSMEYTTAGKKVLKKMAGKTKLCRFLHMPVQHAHNSILSAMKRKYTFEEFRDFIASARDSIKDICIGTDFIAGFPGETSDIFREAFENMRKLPVNYMHVFSYSSRPNARSKNFTQKVSFAALQNRSRRLRELSKTKRQDFLQSLLDSKQNVLFEEHKKGYYTGFTDNYVRVWVKSRTSLENNLRRVRLEKVKDDGLTGSLVEKN